MAKAYVFYNPYAGNGHCKERLELLASFLKDEPVYCDMTDSETYETRLFEMAADDYLVLCGGDGTLNRFVNLMEDVEIPQEIFYFPVGSGNDFARDLDKHYGDPPFPITKYLKNLPFVEVKNRKYRFINGIGYGLDGYCCEAGDKLRKSSTKPIHYPLIAVKGLLAAYKPTNATVTVDGVSHSYKKVWLAPTMNGRYYGGGIMPTPQQKRISSDRTLSVMVVHDASKLTALFAFPSIMKGEHLRLKKYVEVLTGHEITVTFDRPTPLQVDGETILNVTSYRAGFQLQPQAVTVADNLQQMFSSQHNVCKETVLV